MENKIDKLKTNHHVIKPVQIQGESKNLHQTYFAVPIDKANGNVVSY